MSEKLKWRIIEITYVKLRSTHRVQSVSKRIKLQFNVQNTILFLKMIYFVKLFFIFYAVLSEKVDWEGNMILDSKKVYFINSIFEEYIFRYHLLIWGQKAYMIFLFRKFIDSNFEFCVQVSTMSCKQQMWNQKWF